MIDTGSCNRIRYVQGNVSSDAFGHSDQQCFRDTRRTGAGDFRGRNWRISTSRANAESLMEISHPQWYDIVRVFDGRACRFQRNDWADVLSLTDEEVTYKWDQWGTETFRRKEDGSFFPFRKWKSAAFSFLTEKESGCTIYLYRALYNLLERFLMQPPSNIFCQATMSAIFCSRIMMK